MSDEIGALQCLPRYLSVECLHGWNLGQPLIVIHESVDFREPLKQSANGIVSLWLIKNQLSRENS